jgi:predicted RNA binding protein YcfA (HicA-like mRNA interferase family)
MVRVLQRLGWVVERQRGSHISLYHPGTDAHASIPVHGNRDLASGIRDDLLRRAGLTAADLRRLLARR